MGDDENRRRAYHGKSFAQKREGHMPTPGKQPLTEQLPPSRIGKTTLTELLDNEYVTNGPTCEVNPSSADCFLAAKQRDRLIGWLTHYVQTAQTNYKLALVDLKMTELLKKPEDLNLVLGLTLDLAGAHLIATIGSALKGLR